MGLTGFGGAGVASYPRASYGFDNELWFGKDGYTPHYAEHVIDPTDNKEKLVMADPHTRFSAFIYNLADRRIEWEYVVPGSAVNNPHTARMLMTDVANFGSAGDIYCCSRDQHIIVIDRNTQAIKKDITLSAGAGQWNPTWLHEACLGSDGLHLILTDYQDATGYGVSKYKLSDGSIVWHRSDFVVPAKVHVIKGRAYPGCSFGGDYIICCNDANGLVAEIKDSDGTIAWARPNSQDGFGQVLSAPHAAFRIGRAEWFSPLTIVCAESGGGIVAVHYTGQPIWAIGNRYGRTHGDGHLYWSTAMGTIEITHVFPTLDGRIGFIDWNAPNSSKVVVLSEIPQKQHLDWRHARKKATINTDDFTDYIAVADMDETRLVIQNNGGTGKALAWEVHGCLNPHADYKNHPEMWVEEKASAVVADGTAESHQLTRPYTFIVVLVKSNVADNHTTYDMYIDQVRN